MKSLTLIFLVVVSFALLHVGLSSTESTSSYPVTSEYETELIRKLSHSLERIIRQITDALERGKSVSRQLIDQARDIVTKLKELGADFSSKTKSLLHDLKQKVKNWWDDLLRRLKIHKDEHEHEAKRDLLEHFRNLIDRLKIKQHLEKVQELIASGFDVSKIREYINEKLPFGVVKDKIIDMLSKGKDRLKNFLDKVLNRSF